MKRRSFFANRAGLQLAIRELLDLFASARFWIGFASVQIVLWVSAPFDSGEEFTAIQRAVYWLGVSAATFFPAFVLIRWIDLDLRGRIRSRPLITVISGAIAGLPVGLIVFTINSYIAGNDNGEFKDVIRLILICTPITIAVAVMAELLFKTSEPATTPAHDLMTYLSPENRGAIVSLQAQDHYVEVVTGGGRELVLIRLADAIALLPKGAGMQVHRSWWLAHDATAALEKDAHRWQIRLLDGRVVPVGRSRTKAVRTWMENR